jgi:DNA-binding NarL/FixJ family response regulator
MTATVSRFAEDRIALSPRGIPKGIIVAARRALVRGYIATWLAAFCPDCDPAATAETLEEVPTEAIETAVAVVLDASCPGWDAEWIRHQVQTSRERFPNLPIVLIVDPVDLDSAREAVLRLNLRGYIPTTDTAEVAAAALHLVIAGGRYLPRTAPGLDVLPVARSEEIRASPNSWAPNLTLRERAVLQLLQAGLPNKVIAHRLGLSLSTVKIHVHHIIHKLKVRNRTEAAIAAGSHNALNGDRNYMT